MLNFCRIDLARQINAQLNSVEGDKIAAYETIATEILLGKSRTLPSTEFEKEQFEKEKANIISWLSEDLGYIPQATAENLANFFMLKDGTINQKLYVDVKKDVVNKIVTSIFTNNRYSGTNSNLNNIINSLIKSLKKRHKYTGNITSPVVHYYTLQKSLQNNKPLSVRDFSSYLIINHFQAIATNWLSDLIVFDPDTNSYSYASTHDLDEDWTTEKEPDLNVILQLLIKNTTLYDFSTESPIPINVPLRQKDFIDSSIEIIRNMPEARYNEIIKNPYHIIDYLVDTYFGSKSKFHGENFAGNFMKSFIYEWIYDTNMYHGIGENWSNKTGSGHYLLDIIVRSMTKYMPKKYIEYDLNGSPSTFDNVPNSYSKAYGQFCDFVDMMDINEFYDKNGKLKVNILKFAQDLFGRNYTDINSRPNFKTLVEIIYDFLNTKNSTDNFKDYIAGNDNHEILLEELNYANRFNPFSISGTINNAADKPLPVTGLQTVAGDITRCVYENRAAMDRIRSQYNQINSTRNTEGKHLLKVPVSPIKHSSFEEFKKNNISNLFLGTIYRSTIKKKIVDSKENEEEIIKEVGEMSSPESFTLSFIEDFYKGWVEKNGNIRFEAITPSDKPLIPFFEWNTSAVRKRYKGDNKAIEQVVCKEVENIYGQILLNSAIDFAQVLGHFDLIKDIDADYTKVGYKALMNLVNNINGAISNLTENQLQFKVREFNLANGTNINLAAIHDYNKNKSEKLVMNNLLVNVVDMFANKKIDHLYAGFLNSVSKEIGTLIIDDQTQINVSELIEGNNLTKTAKDSLLYTYFLLNLVLNENILINTVGTHISHKNEIENRTFEEADSMGHLTMVKRMVALTATMHSALNNVLSGLPEELNIVTLENKTSEMFAYSGNSTEGEQFLSKLKGWDGAMWSIGVVSKLLKQSTADTKPMGMAQKLLVHHYDPHKGGAVLLKMANFVIDNAFLRCFYNPDLANEFDYNPMNIMKMSLDQCIIDKSSIDTNTGHIVDYRGFDVFTNLYFKVNDEIFNIRDISYVDNENVKNKFVIQFNNINSENIETLTVDNNLFALWQGIGGQFSCDENGNYNESSQDFIFNLINTLGSTDKDVVRTQNDIDQYLKRQLIHYFPTVEASKSLKTPVTNIKDALSDNSKRLIYKIGLNHFGFQLDPDHEADDSTVKEITQLISFISEGMFVPEHTKKVYGNLKRLLDELSNKTFMNIDSISDPGIREAYRHELDKIFSKKMKRVFTDTNVNVVSLTNEIIREIIKTEDLLKIPYSDGQMIGKSHTSIGSEFNKYISRQWTGRGDVLVPSHNIAMIFEDKEGNTYMGNDMKIHPDGKKESIRTYLTNLVWEDKSAGIMKTQFLNENQISAYEVMPTDVYYHWTNGHWIPTTVETWKQLNEIRDDILNGAIYVRALDRPRNLRSKQVFLDVITNNGEQVKIGMYHFQTMQKIAALGIMLNEAKELKSINEINLVNSILGTDFKLGDKLTDNDKERIIKAKRSQQKKFEDEILPAIANNKLEIISTELSDILHDEQVVSFNYRLNEEERLTTNNYGSAFGIRNMNFAEISQKKEQYFYEHLFNTFAKPEIKGFIPYDYLLYTNKGVPTGIITNREKINSSSYFIQSDPVVNEDGYRIDKHGKPMYKWPEGARLFKYKLESIEIETILINPENIGSIIEDQSFVFYRVDQESNLPLLNNARNLYLLNDNDSENERVFRRIAKKQYNSWLKSNIAIMARIPSQSLAFAMSIKTVGYLPYSNNVTMVPNSNVFLEGSDYEIL